MKAQLISGTFEKADAIDLMTKMVNAKVKFHESKIKSTSTEEDVKMRETKIKTLQKELYDIRNYVEQKQEVTINCEIILQ
jgi:Spy/CpxP family protein refolding chaperone